MDGHIDVEVVDKEKTDIVPRGLGWVWTRSASFLPLLPFRVDFAFEPERRCG